MDVLDYDFFVSRRILRRSSRGRERKVVRGFGGGGGVMYLVCRVERRWGMMLYFWAKIWRVSL